MLMNTNHLIDHLAALTAVRDLELLELSLLKTLKEMLKLSNVKLLNLNKDDNKYTLRGYVQDDKSKELIETAEEGGLLGSSADALPVSLCSAIARADWSGKPASHFQPDCFTMVYPLRGKGIIFGYVLVTGDKPPMPSETQMIEGMLRVFFNYYTLLEDSQRDKLTGLLNRKTFDDRIDKIIEIAAKYSESIPTEERRKVGGGTCDSFWLAVIDIDHFKKINDNFGHLYGDEVLLLLSQIMKRSFRRRDLLFRFGGEEFIIVISSTDSEGAYTAFDNFRQIVSGFNFPQIGQVTISLGATKIERSFIPSEIVGRADRALYHAKRNGRNCLHFYEDLVQDGNIKPDTQHGSVELF